MIDVLGKLRNVQKQLLQELRREATMEEIASVPGIPVEVAEAVKAHLA